MVQQRSQYLTCLRSQVSCPAMQKGKRVEEKSTNDKEMVAFVPKNVVTIQGHHTEFYFNFLLECMVDLGGKNDTN